MVVFKESNVDGIAIGLCPSSAARTDAAIRAAYVFNDRQQLGLAVGQPLARCRALAFGTVPITAGRRSLPWLMRRGPASPPLSRSDLVL
jgi:hypothetical protein